MFKLILMPLIATLLLSFPAAAAKISVNFATDGNVDEDLGFYQYLYGEQELSIVSYVPKNAVVQSSFGLGVGNDRLDSPDEALLLKFSHEVSNLKLTFADWDVTNDKLNFSTSGVNSFCVGNCTQSLPEIDENGELQFLYDVSSLFINVYGDDDSTSTSLFSASWDDGSPSVVPLPAALPLYAAGMGLMGLVGWRKRRKSAG